MAASSGSREIGYKGRPSFFVAWMLPPYNKPYLTFAEQAQLLRQRGLEITNVWQAERHLARIGYYRLKDYWQPLLQSQVSVQPDGTQTHQIAKTFRPGTRFDHAVRLYVFDKQLRMC